jgi:hypothetical protein
MESKAVEKKEKKNGGIKGMHKRGKKKRRGSRRWKKNGRIHEKRVTYWLLQTRDRCVQ